MSLIAKTRKLERNNATLKAKVKDQKKKEQANTAAVCDKPACILVGKGGMFH